MKKTELNDNDNKLLSYCFNRPRHLSDIARYLKISVKNVSVRIKDLEDLGEIYKPRMIGRKKYIRTKGGDKTKEYFYKLLARIQSEGGQMKKSDFLGLVPFAVDNKMDKDKFDAPLKLMYSQPKLVEHYVRITPAGEQFLRDNGKSN